MSERRRGETPRDVPELLGTVEASPSLATANLIPLVYKELRHLAADFLRHERSGHTLQPTAVVHEAFSRLIERGAATWPSRAHFFAIAASEMRRVLVDHARARGRHKRGGGLCRVSLDEQFVQAASCDIDVLVLDESIARLAVRHERQSRVVELRFFGGLTIEEAAEILKVSRKTVAQDWSFARAWLLRDLQKELTS